MLMDSLEDKGKMQQRAIIFDEKGYKTSADTIGQTSGGAPAQQSCVVRRRSFTKSKFLL